MEAAQRVVFVLRKLAGWRSPQEIAKACGLHPKEVAPAIESLVERQHLKAGTLEGYGCIVPVFCLTR